MSHCKYVGVFKNGRNWQSRIRLQGKRYNLGTFETPNMAAQMRDRYSLLLHQQNALIRVQDLRGKVYSLMLGAS